MAATDSEALTVPGYPHQYPPIRNVNDLMMEQRTLGQRAADAFATLVGSWRFIIVQSVILLIWITLNVFAWVNHWDPYPFILLNLALSFQAAYAGPIIMMSQNHQSAKDRIAAQFDYEINMKSEEEIQFLMLRAEETQRYMFEVLMLLRQREQEINTENGHEAALPTDAQ